MSTDIEHDAAIEEDDEQTDVTTPQESPAATQLRISLLEYCRRRGGDCSPESVLKGLRGRTNLNKLSDVDARRAHVDFESRYLGADPMMD